MAFGMFSAQSSPIAIDFGSSSVKLLQIGGGDKPALLAAADAPVPDTIRADVDRTFAFYEEWIPKFVRDGKFKGRRAVITLPAALAFTQHMQVAENEGATRDDAIKAQLQMQMGCSPDSVVVRSIEVCPVNRNGQARTEMICFAIGKDKVMRYIDMLRRCKLEVVGVQTEMLAMVRGFDHLYRREDDEKIATLFVDIGWGGTRTVVTHGRNLVFARYISIGGRSFDQLIATAAKCDLPSARGHRLAIKSKFEHAQPAQHSAPRAQTMAAANHEGGGGTATLTMPAKTTLTIDRRTGAPAPGLSAPLAGGEMPESSIKVDLSEMIETLADELQMSLRYYRGLFANRRIDRAIFVGGESRQPWLCQQLVKSLNVPAQLGNPLARLDTTQAPVAINLNLRQSQPGWAVVCGLCTAPTDL